MTNLRPIHTQYAVPMPFPCHAVPLRVYNVSFSFDLHSAAVSDSHLPCRAYAILLKATAQHGRRETAVLCCDLEKNGMVRAWHGRGMASVNPTRPHCVNQMGKTHSKPLATRHGRGTSWAWHDTYESAFKNSLLATALRPSLMFFFF